ncbi:type IV toxin-antitoxin system AbiEi family antitoxin domain-containing protein [Rhizobium rhizosphaerae]|uniref:type IV toxin-antitoxin system AbiEi family antitoxin domain-containing protein n=1 Tax=Xaviernesmea rhizosphaerae TaxID=1672749 RepID=UPI001FD99693|nr:type IV toxin-antitoxin system AbiEi family antitoxin domain-containing protein [Xaviernesmea rhizosphaerae]
MFAERRKHSSRERLNPDDFKLGTGDRARVKGGKIHPRYRIMALEFCGNLRNCRWPVNHMPPRLRC